jgi:ATP-dependent helicase/nuclease subunit B
VLYFKLDNPLLNFSDISSNDTVASALYKKFKTSGVVLEEFDIIRRLDNGIESKSDIIPVAIKSGAAFKKLPIEERPVTETSSVLTENDFQRLMDFSIEKAVDTGQRILTGEISANPFKYGNLSGCGYCAYKSVCRFDPVINAKDYNMMNTMKSKQALQNILQKGIDKS